MAQAFESSIVLSNRRHRGKTVSTNVPFFFKAPDTGGVDTNQ